MSTLPSGRIQFGAFELDLSTGELRSIEAPDPNNKIVLREQVFQVLRMLLEREGKIVTREEIKGRLWPNDTVVDFDHSINATIRTLRRALGDSADDPRYIETLARRGYRLMVVTEYLESAPGIAPEEVTAEAPLQSSSLAGKKVSHYRVLDVIGAGGMGMVFKAEDLNSLCARGPQHGPLLNDVRCVQHSRWATANQFGTGCPESGFGIRHSLRAELCWLPRRARPRRSIDCPSQSGVSRHRR
jgi:DNA-binding winged helix-turn-helix (wHTH) protein